MRERSGSEVGKVLSAFEMARGVSVRRVDEATEVKRWDATMRQNHYLGFKTMVGETMRYVAEVDGKWAALVGFASAARKIASRDEYIGWDPSQREQRLPYVVQNARFLILEGYHVPNMGSRVLGLTLRRLSQDWHSVHGHRVLLCETFVDPSRFDGTVYRGAGWTYLGMTAGYAKAGASYVEHGQPKQVWVRALMRHAPKVLRQAFWPTDLGADGPVLDPKRLPLEGRMGLLAHLQNVEDPRKARGIRHPFVSVLAVSVLAVICGARSCLGIAQWAQGLSPDLLRRLGCFCSPTTGKYAAPSEPTIRRSLSRVDAVVLAQVVSAYVANVVTRPAREHIAVDGKTLRGSGSQASAPRRLLMAVRHGLGTVLGQRFVGAKENEIPVAPRLLSGLYLDGAVVTADAMHTQMKLVDYIVTAGADYVLTIKANQPSLLQAAAALDWHYSPQVTVREKHHGRVECRSIQVIHAHDGLGFAHVEQVARVERTVKRRATKGGAMRTTKEVVYVITSLYPEHPEQSDAKEILDLVRAHWTVESIHWIRDVTYDEDRSQIRTESGPQAMAAPRNLAISLIRSWPKYRSVPEAHRRLWGKPEALFVALAI